MPNRKDVSAGLLAYRRKPKGSVEYLLVHPGGPYWTRRDLGAWGIPKGLVEADDELLATAKREFLEETGMKAVGVFFPLAPVKQKSGKTVHAFAFECDFDLSNFKSNAFEIEWPPRSGKMKQFPEIDRIAYFSETNAVKKMIAYQQPFLKEMREILIQRNK